MAATESDPAGQRQRGAAELAEDSAQADVSLMEEQRGLGLRDAAAPSVRKVPREQPAAQEGADRRRDGKLVRGPVQHRKTAFGVHDAGAEIRDQNVVRRLEGVVEVLEAEREADAEREPDQDRELVVARPVGRVGCVGMVAVQKDSA